jgi:hypothetical protein
MYGSIDTRKPQSSMSDRTSDTSGPRPTDASWGAWEGGPWRGVGCDGRITGANIQGFDLLPDDALRHTPTQILHQKPHTAVRLEREGVETHALPHRGTAVR